MHENTLGCRAYLSGVKERAERGRAGGQFQVGVIEDHGRTVTAEFQQERLARGTPGDVFARRTAAGKCHGVGAGMRHDLVTNDRPGTGHQIDSPRRHFGLLQALHEFHRDHGGRWGRHPDHRIAAGQARGQVLSRNVQGEIPRRDDRVHAARLPDREDPLVWILHGNHRRLQPLDVIGRVAPPRDRRADFRLRLGVQGFSLIEREGSGQFVPAALQHVGDAGTHPRPVPDRHPRQPGFPLVCGRNGALGILPRSLGESRDGLPGGGAPRLVGRPRHAGDPAPANVHLQRVHLSLQAHVASKNEGSPRRTKISDSVVLGGRKPDPSRECPTAWNGHHRN